MTEEFNITNHKDVIIDMSKRDLRLKVEVNDSGVDESKIKEVQQMVAGMTDSYHTWAMEDIKKLQLAYNDLVYNPKEYKTKLKAVYEIAHDMKGQGGSFDYHMVTYIGDYLCRFLERIKEQPTQKILEVIELHVRAIDMILTNKIRGKISKQGEEILLGLEATLKKFAPDIVEVLHAFHSKEKECELKRIEKGEID